MNKNFVLPLQSFNGPFVLEILLEKLDVPSKARF